MKQVFAVFLILPFLAACDYRPTGPPANTVVTFQAEAVVVKDTAGVGDLVGVKFWRNNVYFSDAIIKVAQQTIPSIGGGNYRLRSPVLTMPVGHFTLTFSVPAENYQRSFTLEMPGRFAIGEVHPRNNPLGFPVLVRWTAAQASDQARYFISVKGRRSATSGAKPLAFDVGLATEFVIPDSAFRDVAGHLCADVYDIWVIAYTRGFSEYEGMVYLLPTNLPRWSITDPEGHIGCGRVAPPDSVVVLP